MTDLILVFNPQDDAAPPWQAAFTLSDGRNITVAAVWNHQADDWFVQVEDGQGSALLFAPMTGSVRGVSEVNLLELMDGAPSTPSQLYYYPASGTMEFTA